MVRPVNPDLDTVRLAHAEYDRTRCAGWLLSTGNRPNRASDVTLAKGPQEVTLRAVPRPSHSCDIHPAS